MSATEHRIAKLLARAGVASRREVERMIAEGRVALNGTVIDTPATLLRNLSGVTVDGNPVDAPTATRLFLFHKPTGLLVTERDPAGRPTIYDALVPDLPRLVPVGRLDLNTEGLLLLTTDGSFKRQLELPATGVERTYRARAYGDITQAQLEELSEGIEIDGIRYGSIDANLERRTGANVWIEMTLTEGKNREVRRVLEHLGLQVSRLIRTRYGPFLLGDLPIKGIGEVLQHDLVAFRKTLKGGVPEDEEARAPAPGRREDARPVRTREAPRQDRPSRPAARPAPRDDARPPRRPEAARTERSARPERGQDTRPPRRSESPRTEYGARDGARPSYRPEGPRTERSARPDRRDEARPSRRPEGQRSDRSARPERREDARPFRQPGGSRQDRSQRAPRDDARSPRRDDARPPRRDDARPPRRDDAAARADRSPRRDDARGPRSGESRFEGPARPGRHPSTGGRSDRPQHGPGRPTRPGAPRGRR